MRRMSLCLGWVVALVGCFEAPPEVPPECFLEGDVVLDLQTKQDLQIDADRSSDACCEENRDCIDLFAASGAGIQIADLAVCDQARRGNGKVCTLDCELGGNCECVRNDDCNKIDPGDQTSLNFACTVGAGAQCDFASGDDTTSANNFTVSAGSARCAYCARCVEDIDCDEAGRRFCDNGVCAECTSNNDCTEDDAGICHNGACVGCGEDADCAEGQTCADDNTCE